MASKLNDICEKYKTFVINNHGIVGNIESGFRLLSFLTPGRTEHSAVLSELIYSASNLLIFLNDAILRQAAHIKLKVPLPHKDLCSWLTVLQHIEVFLEIAGQGFGGEVYRWIIIVCVQIAKAAIRLVLLLKYNSGIQPTPPIPVLRRDRGLQKRLDDVANDRVDEHVIPESHSIKVKQTYNLTRSGRTIRTLESAPPLLQRNWRIPTASEKISESHVIGDSSTRLGPLQTLGECLHITRPIAHLLSMYVFGLHSWKSWLVAGSMDTSSLYLLGDKYQFNMPECEEIRRRQILMTLYMLRSPFYDRHTKERLITMLRGMATYIPGVRLVIRPLLDYLPWWQRIYFYVWMQ